MQITRPKGANYPLTINLTNVPILGFFPCSKIADLKILPPAQTEKSANISTKITPRTGCQKGMVTCVASLTGINIGVNGGNKEAQIAKLLIGF